MDAQQFLAEFGHIANAPAGVSRLRDLVLALAVQGRLVPQLESEEPAAMQLARVAVAAANRPATGRRKKAVRASQVDSGTSAMPKGWARTRLCDLVRVLNGRAYSKQELLESGTPVLRVGNLFTSDHWYYSDLDLEADKYCDDGDLLFAWSASFGPFIWNGGRVIFHYHIWKLDLFSLENLNKRFLYTWLLEKTQEIKASGHGISMAHMTKERFELLEVALPPFDEQSRIVAKVDELMALCDQLEEQQQDRRKLQNAMRQAMLQALASAQSPHELQTSWQRLQANFGNLFTETRDTADLDQTIKRLALRGLLTGAQGGEHVSQRLVDLAASSINFRLADNDWPVPSHWIWACCSWLGEARLGKMLDASKNKGEFRPYLRNINVRWHHFALGDVLKMRVEEHELERVSVKRGDLVICEGGEPGRAAIWNSDEEFVIQKALHRFRCGPDVLPEYLLFCIEHDYFSGRLARYYTGATIKHLTGKALADYSVPLPPIAEQHRILAAASAMSSVVAALRDQLFSATRSGELVAAAAVAALTGINIEQDEDTVKAPQTELIAPLRLATPPDVKAQAPLAAILARYQGEMSARDVWQRFGGEIDAFYAQLKTEVAHGWIAEPELAQVREKPTAEAAKA